MTLEEMKAMNLHEEIQIGDTDWVMRVPNGWRYITLTDSGHISTTFVPEIIITQKFYLPKLP